MFVQDSNENFKKYQVQPPSLTRHITCPQIAKSQGGASWCLGVSGAKYRHHDPSQRHPLHDFHQRRHPEIREYEVSCFFFKFNLLAPIICQVRVDQVWGRGSRPKWTGDPGPGDGPTSGRKESRHPVLLLSHQLSNRRRREHGVMCERCLVVIVKKKSLRNCLPSVICDVIASEIFYLNMSVP